MFILNMHPTSWQRGDCKRDGLPFTEGVETGEDLGVGIAIEAYAANQELLVDLTHNWAGEGSCTFTGHPKALAQESHSLSPHTLHTHNTAKPHS